MSGSIVKTATAVLGTVTNQWEVDVAFTGSGSAQFNRYAAKHYNCYLRDPSNPPSCALQAIEVNARVEAVPAVEASSFSDGATIAGSPARPLTRAQAIELAFLVRSSSSMAPVRG